MTKFLESIVKYIEYCKIEYLFKLIGRWWRWWVFVHWGSRRPPDLLAVALIVVNGVGGSCVSQSGRFRTTHASKQFHHYECEPNIIKERAGSRSSLLEKLFIQLGAPTQVAGINIIWSTALSPEGQPHLGWSRSRHHGGWPTELPTLIIQVHPSHNGSDQQRLEVWPQLAVTTYNNDIKDKKNTEFQQCWWPAAQISWSLQPQIPGIVNRVWFSDNLYSTHPDFSKRSGSWKEESTRLAGNTRHVLQI